MNEQSPPDINTVLNIYSPLFQEVQTYEIIPELKEQYNEVMATITNCLRNHTTFPVESAQKLDSILTAYFKRICFLKITELNNKLPDGKSYSFHVSKYRQKLQRLKIKIEIETDLGPCRETLILLKEIEEEIKDELIIQNDQKKQFWKGVLYGGIIGYIAGIASTITIDFFRKS